MAVTSIGVFSLLPIAYEGEGRDGYRDQIVTCDVGVSLHSKTHPLFMKYSNGTSTQCYAYHNPSLFPVLFLQSLYVPFEFFIYLYNIDASMCLIFMYVSKQNSASLSERLTICETHFCALERTV